MKPSVLNCFFFCFQNALKLNYEHLQLLKFAEVYAFRPLLKREGKGFGREGPREIGGRNICKGGEEGLTEVR
jgi:hypothetical protein